MRSPLLPELTLLQSSEHPSHSWGCSSLPPCPGCTHPGASPLVEVRQAWLFLFLEARAGGTLKVKAGIFREMGFLPIPIGVSIHPSPCCLPPHPKGVGRTSVIDWI